MYKIGRIQHALPLSALPLRSSYQHLDIIYFKMMMLWGFQPTPTLKESVIASQFQSQIHISMFRSSRDHGSCSAERSY